MEIVQTWVARRIEKQTACGIGMAGRLASRSRDTVDARPDTDERFAHQAELDRAAVVCIRPVEHHSSARKLTGLIVLRREAAADNILRQIERGADIGDHTRNFVIRSDSQPKTERRLLRALIALVHDRAVARKDARKIARYRDRERRYNFAVLSQLRGFRGTFAAHGKLGRDNCRGGEYRGAKRRFQALLHVRFILVRILIVEIYSI